jgi:hypothetical protein
MDFQNFTHKKTLYNQQQVIACIGQYLKMILNIISTQEGIQW